MQWVDRSADCRKRQQDALADGGHAEPGPVDGERPVRLGSADPGGPAGGQ